MDDCITKKLSSLLRLFVRNPKLHAIYFGTIQLQKKIPIGKPLKNELFISMNIYSIEYQCVLIWGIFILQEAVK